MTDLSDTPLSNEEWDRMLIAMQLAKNHEQKVVTQSGDVSTIASTFFDEMDRREARLGILKLDGPISENEWKAAKSKPRPVVDKWLYEDVGVFIAPGGTGKTTLLLFQIIHIVLGKLLFGYEVKYSGPVVIMTAEDSRETLVARLRYMCYAMHLTPEEIRTVREEIIITDVSGMGLKFTTVERDVVLPSKALDKLIVEIGVLCPSLLVIDPMVSFGVGESRVNDAEQGMIDAGRRIRNAAKCAVLYVHHTGKMNARDKTTDQYSGRGGSALADGARMVHVLQRLEYSEWTGATGDVLGPDDAGFVLARPKMTWCPPQPDIYLKRRGFIFERIAAIDPSESATSVDRINAERIWQFLCEELLANTKHSGKSVETAKLMPQKATRAAVQRLIMDGRVVSEKLTTGGRGGAHTYLRPVDMAVTT